MLVFSAVNLAFIAVPKTGTTAVEMALKPKADIIFTKRRKHLTALKFHRKIAPFLTAEFGVNPDRFAVMREPQEQIRSWYRYRARSERAGDAFSTSNISFDQFVRDVISDDPPAYARIGTQAGMLLDREGNLLIHHLFAHAVPQRLQMFLDTRFDEEIVIKTRNVSPAIQAELDPKTERALKAARAQEYDLYARLMEAQGYLETVV